MTDPRARWALVACAGVAVLAVSAGWLATHRSSPVRRGTVPVASSSAPRSPTVRAPSQPAQQAAASLGFIPDELSIARLGVTAPATSVIVGSDGSLGVPDDPHTVGWWAGGARPGTSRGTAVFDGHVDSATAGAGALFELRRIAVADVVTVSGPAGRATYRITGVREYDKGALPSSALFVTTGAPRLVLITCGGPFDSATHHYRDNIVAFGLPA
jgi:sortase family protein